MALQSSGAISINDVAGEFGGSTPHSLSEYYSAASGVPSSGAISLSDFYGTSAAINIEWMLVAGAGGGQAGGGEWEWGPVTYGGSGGGSGGAAIRRVSGAPAPNTSGATESNIIGSKTATGVT